MREDARGGGRPEFHFWWGCENMRCLLALALPVQTPPAGVSKAQFPEPRAVDERRRASRREVASGDKQSPCNPGVLSGGLLGPSRRQFCINEWRRRIFQQRSLGDDAALSAASWRGLSGLAAQFACLVCGVRRRRRHRRGRIVQRPFYARGRRAAGKGGAASHSLPQQSGFRREPGKRRLEFGCIFQS